MGSSESSNRYKKHRNERIVAWVVALLVIALLTLGLVFLVKQLKGPVISAVKDLLKMEEEAESSQIAESEPQAEEAEPVEKPMDEESLSAIFEEEEEETGESASQETTDDDPILESARQIVDGMTLQQQVAQLFFVMPESITGVATVTAAGEKTRLALEQYPVGGIILMGSNIEDPKQLSDMTANLQRFSAEVSGVPLFIGVDEEGGRVLRIASNKNFVTGSSDKAGEGGETDEGNETGEGDETASDGAGDDSAVKVSPMESMAEIGKTGEPDRAYEAGSFIGTYLGAYGINLDLAPVADVCSEGEDNGIGNRSFGEDPELVADMSLAYLKGLHSAGVLGCVKHFPGHGSVDSDTHDGTASTSKDWDQLMQSDLIPFEKAIKDGAQLIMASHICVPELTRDEIPASTSALLLTEKLRGEMGFQGVILSDAMNMKAITEKYDSADAATAVLSAGGDMILAPEDFGQAYDGVMAALEEGSLSADRVKESACRIVAAKLHWQQLAEEAAGGSEDTDEDSEKADGESEEASESPEESDTDSEKEDKDREQ